MTKVSAEVKAKGDDSEEEEEEVGYNQAREEEKKRQLETVGDSWRRTVLRWRDNGSESESGS